MKEKTGFFVSANKELSKVMSDRTALGSLIASWRDALPRPLDCFMAFWDFDLELIKITLIYHNTAGKTLLRILFIIERRLARFERFKNQIRDTNETFHNRLRARDRARQAVAWYQFLWYGISEDRWRYGFDSYDKELRQKYLKNKVERRQSRMKGGKT
jgi:hypothetical protein